MSLSQGEDKEQFPYHIAKIGTLYWQLTYTGFWM